MSFRFIHNKTFIISVIPKNANKTIKLMSARLSNKSLEGNLKKSVLKKYFFKTLTYKQIHKYSVPKILLVRNPYNRIFSAWNQKIRNGTSIKKYGIPKHFNFDDFLDFISTKKIQDLNIHFKPQICFFRDTNAFDYVLKMEEEKTWDILEKFFGMKSRHVNKSPSISYNISEEESRKIRQIYKKDFEVLDYKF